MLTSNLHQPNGRQYIRENEPDATHDNSHQGTIAKLMNNSHKTYNNIMLTACHKFILQSTLMVALLALSVTPAPVRNIREQNEPSRSTIHSRLLSDLYQYHAYLFVLPEINCAASVNTTIQNPSNDLKAILNDMCGILSFYDMLSAVNESKGKDLHQILERIVVDGCNWTKIIVSTTDSANLSQSGEESCPEFLRKQCVAQHAKEGWLRSKLESSKNSIRQYGQDFDFGSSNQTVPFINSLQLSCI